MGHFESRGKKTMNGNETMLLKKDSEKTEIKIGGYKTKEDMYFDLSLLIYELLNSVSESIDTEDGSMADLLKDIKKGSTEMLPLSLTLHEFLGSLMAYIISRNEEKNTEPIYASVFTFFRTITKAFIASNYIEENQAAHLIVGFVEEILGISDKKKEKAD